MKALEPDLMSIPVGITGMAVIPVPDEAHMFARYALRNAPWAIGKVYCALIIQRLKDQEYKNFNGLINLKHGGG